MVESQYQVTVLRNGVETNEQHGCVTRQCSIVLIQGPCGIMVVNPGSAWDGPFLIKALKSHGVDDIAQIKYVVCTDGRAIHVGLLSMFTKAEMIIVGHDIQKPNDLFIEHDFSDDSVPFEFDENVRLIYLLYRNILVGLNVDSLFQLSVVGTPGTMDQQVTVLVRGVLCPDDSFTDNPPTTPISIAITGSIFADAQDAAKTGIFHTTALSPDLRRDTSSYLSVWRSSRNRLLGLADWIIPAFGEPFKVRSLAFHLVRALPIINPTPRDWFLLFVFR